MSGTKPPTQGPRFGEPAPFLPPMSPWVKFVLYVVGQSANGCLMFEAFAPGSAGIKVCGILIFVLGTLGFVFKRG